MLEGICTDHSVDIFIRHGKSRYTNKLPDITPEGIEQARSSAREQRSLVESYNHFRVNSSPAVRALGTAYEFLDELGIQTKIHQVDGIRPVDIYRFPEFTSALNDPMYQKEYEAYLLKKEFDDPNPKTRICERRSDIRRRAIDYFIRRMNLEDQTDPVCSLHFTHFEVMSTLLAALYGDVNNFPIDTVEGPKNGEAIAIQKYSPREMTIYARSMSANVCLMD